MRYVSTRGGAASLDFVDVMLAGLARDGGLYVPETWPTLEPTRIAGLAGRPYAEVAVEVIRPFIAGGIAESQLARMAQEAYGVFRHPAVVPLVQLAPGLFVLELFHGPTLAFKDSHAAHRPADGLHAEVAGRTCHGCGSDFRGYRRRGRRS